MSDDPIARQEKFLRINAEALNRSKTPKIPRVWENARRIDLCLPANQYIRLDTGTLIEIDPVVAEALTTYQVEWLFVQCQDLRFKKLQILRQALFEWVGESSRIIDFLPTLLGTSCAWPSRII